MIRYRSLASGSDGNCYLIEDGSTRILVDCGITAKRLRQILSADCQIDVTSIDGLAITHAHKDHTLGLPTLVHRYHRQTYISLPSLQLIEKRCGNQLDRAFISTFQSGNTFKIGTYTIESYKVDHDTPDCHAFIIQSEDGSRLCVATDLGSVPPQLLEQMRTCHHIILESNYSPTLLQTCSYSAYLKGRIAGGMGHLSNQQAGEVIRKLIGSSVSRINLAHLSRNSNTPDIAKKYAQQQADGHFHIHTFPRMGADEWIEING